MVEDLSITEQFYNQVSESIKSVFDLTSRIDERVKMLIEKQNELDDKFEKIMHQNSNLSTRLSVLESKDFGSIKSDIEDIEKRLVVLEIKFKNDKTTDKIDKLDNQVRELELKQQGHDIFKLSTEARITRSIDIIFKLVIGVATGFLLWKWGIKQ